MTLVVPTGAVQSPELHPSQLSGQWRPHKLCHSSSALRLRPRATEQARGQYQASDRGEGAEGGEGEGGEGNCNVSEELELDL